MKFSINEKLCKKENITLNEVLLLILASRTSVVHLLNSMEKKQMLHKFAESDYQPSAYWHEKVSSILANSSTEIPTTMKLEELAIKLQELFPKGKKEGTNTYWRGNKGDIVSKLTKFYSKYGNHWTEQQIIDATKSYVDSYKGNTTLMRVLPYFIHKNVVANGSTDSVSELASILENGPDVKASGDWMDELV